MYSIVCKTYIWHSVFYKVACDLCLDHLHALCAKILEVFEDTESALSLHLLHHTVQQDEGASTTNSCTAVDQQWLVQVGWVLLADSTDEGND